MLWRYVPNWISGNIHLKYMAIRVALPLRVRGGRHNQAVPLTELERAGVLGGGGRRSAVFPVRL